MAVSIEGCLRLEYQQSYQCSFGSPDGMRPPCGDISSGNPKDIGTVFHILRKHPSIDTAIWVPHCFIHPLINVYYRALHCEKLRASCTVT